MNDAKAAAVRGVKGIVETLKTKVVEYHFWYFGKGYSNPPPSQTLQDALGGDQGPVVHWHDHVAVFDALPAAKQRLMRAVAQRKRHLFSRSHSLLSELSLRCVVGFLSACSRARLFRFTGPFDLDLVLSPSLQEKGTRNFSVHTLIGYALLCTPHLHPQTPE